ncbi:hypothetical protein [Stenotrophomonas pavanii]
MSESLTFGHVSHPPPRSGFTYTEMAGFLIAPLMGGCDLARAVQHYPTHGEMEVNSMQSDCRTARSTPRRLMLGMSLALLSVGFAPSAFAGQWVPTGRVLWVDSETIQPYPVAYTNFCQGGVDGPSGVYLYGDWGSEGFGSCPTDPYTGFQEMKGSGGTCRPDPQGVGGGYSCEENHHTFGGQTYQGPMPATCSSPGIYGVSHLYRRELVYFGSGHMPDDFYDRFYDSSEEYVCQ